MIIVELGEYSFYTFSESLVSPGWRAPVFLIQPIWNFKSDIRRFKEILLNFGTEIAFVSKHHAIMIFSAYIVEIMYVMYACNRHVKRMYDTAYVDLYGLGVNTEYVFSAVNGNRYILTDLFGKPRRQFTANIELTTANQVWQIVLAFILQAMKQEISLSQPKASAVMPRAMTSRSKNFGTTSHRGHFRVHSHDFQRNPCISQGF